MAEFYWIDDKFFLYPSRVKFRLIMKTDVVVGTVYSKYDEITGIDPFFWVPGDFLKTILQAVSNKSINMLAGDDPMKQYGKKLARMMPWKLVH